MPAPSQYRFVEQPTRPSRWPTSRGGRCSTTRTCRRLSAQAVTNNLDLRVAVARVEEARARAGIAKSFLYPQVDGVASYAVRQASNAPPPGGVGDEDTTHQSAPTGSSWPGSSTCSAASASERGRIRAVSRERTGPPRRPRDARGRRRVQLLPAARAGLAAPDRAQTLRLNDETVTYFRNRLEGGVSNRLELDQAIANRAQTAAAIPDIENQIGVVENAISMLLGTPARTDRSRDPCVCRCCRRPSRRAADVAPRAAARRRHGRAAAGRVECRRRRRQGAVLPEHQPDRIPRRDQRRSDDVPWRRRRRLVVRRGSASAGVPRQAHQAQLRGHASALHGGGRVYQKAALNGYREVANSLITIQKLAEMRVELQGGGDGPPGRGGSVPLAVRLRARQLHRDPDRGSDALPAAAPPRPDARRRAARPRRALSGARRRMAGAMSFLFGVCSRASTSAVSGTVLVLLGNR